LQLATILSSQTLVVYGPLPEWTCLTLPEWTEPGVYKANTPGVYQRKQ